MSSLCHSSRAGQADVILSNSEFTSRVYARAFSTLDRRPPKVVYPCIDIDAYQPSKPAKKGMVNGTGGDREVELVASYVNGICLQLNFILITVMINSQGSVQLVVLKPVRGKKECRSRHFVFRSPKNREFNRWRAILPIPACSGGFVSLLLPSAVPEGILGGYDDAFVDNVNTLASLRSLCDDLNLSHHTLTSSASPAPPATHVLFVLNFTTSQRSYLLSSPRTLALLYTPANEHFGIVPIEAMASGLPVLAVNSGGPTETIIDLSAGTIGTGLLRPHTPEAWSAALAELINLTLDRRKEVSEAAKRRVKENFSSDTLGRELEGSCHEALAMGDIHTQIGDKLIWGGGMMVVGSAVALGITLWLSHA